MTNSTVNASNPTQGRQDRFNRTDATIIAQWLSLAVLGVIIVLGNLASIITFIKTKSLRKKSHYLIISLSVADLFVGVVDFMATYYFTGAELSDMFYMSLEVVDHFAAAASILTLAMISIERFYAVNYPFLHRRLRFKVYVVFIALPWMIAVVATTLDALSLADIFSINVCEYLSVCLPAVALIIIFFSYIGIGIKTRQKSFCNKNRALRDRKLAVTLFIVTLASLLTWLPHQMFYIVTFFCKTCSLPSFNLLFVTKFLQFSNSGLNVFVYIVRIPDFRAAFLALFCGKIIPTFTKRDSTPVEVVSASSSNGGFVKDKSLTGTAKQNGQSEENKFAKEKLQILQPRNLIDNSKGNDHDDIQTITQPQVMPALAGTTTARDDVDWVKLRHQDQTPRKVTGSFVKDDDIISTASVVTKF